MNEHEKINYVEFPSSNRDATRYEWIPRFTKASFLGSKIRLPLNPEKQSHLELFTQISR